MSAMAALRDFAATIFFLFIFFGSINCEDRAKYGSLKFLDVPLNPRLAATGEITANATCGTGSKEEFCKLVDHVKDKDKVEHCDYCDANIIEKRHPIQYAIDGSNNWWQSPSLARGLNYHHVDIVLNLRQIYQIHWIIIKAANSPRPGNWILERSTDGKAFKPWMYFAPSIEQCKKLNQGGAITQQPEPMLTSDDEVYCTTYFSRPRPVENGEIHIALTKGRPGARTAPLPAKLIEFMSAQYIRLRLQRILTLFGDRMVLPDENDSSVYRRYFYSIKDISVGGRCICYNHATDCTRQTTGNMACNCMHNTCGDHCERCCPQYNQKPWQPEKPCEECNCHNHASTCVYNQTVANLRLSLSKQNKYEGGGQCVDCQDNTAGINCQSCKDGFYRPSTVLPTKAKPCIPCNCHTIGATGSCVPDDSRLASGLFPGKCICRAGFTGDDCNECTIGHKRVNYPPFCVPCTCAIQGSLRDKYTCSAPCSCKENVDELSQCRTCKPGFFNLQMTNAKGCSECFCFGVARECKSSKLGAVEVSRMKGWTVTTENGGKTIKPTMTRQGFPIVASMDIDRAFGPTTVFYWSAPEDYLGNLVTSYGSRLFYIIGFSTDDSTVPVPRPGYEVIIEGDGYRLNYIGTIAITDGRPQVMTLVLSEETAWEITRDPSGRLIVDKRTMMTVLANVTRILIRGQFVSTQVISESVAENMKYILRNVTITKALPGAPNRLPTVEVCKCPDGYVGTSCESCAPGFRRVTSDRYQAVCVPCKCNGHSTTCEQATGKCTKCADNTAGDHCEKCAKGFFGNPKTKAKDACKPCACPHESRNLAEYCIADQLDPNNHICMNCLKGYSGSRCEQCAPGFFGDPKRNIPCRPCECNGNADLNMLDWCNPTTGKCVCRFPTIGDKCDRCRDGYFGSAKNGDCKPCECFAVGSKSPKCDKTGQCDCKPLYATKKCSQCVPGRGNVQKGCLVCDCNPIGTVGQTLCNPVTGNCVCKPGVGSPKCDKCKDGFYDFGDKGCSPCGCNPKGSKSVKCDQSLGRCDCGANVIGEKCERCKPNHFWKPGSTDCENCDCKIGSKDSTCDLNSGQCKCLLNVMGRRCDTCKPGYWGLDKTGCKECPKCSAGQICNPDNGVCECPRFTEGPNCGRCKPNSWGYNKDTGCKLCKCTGSGSIDDTCHSKTGKCKCKPNFMGRRCELCSPGFFGPNKCDRCGCEPRGTRPDTKVGNTLFTCDFLTGQCSCKQNVEGTNCDSCKKGSFGLSAFYETGCFDCYCSSVSKKCSQAKGWVQLLQPPRQRLEITQSPKLSSRRSDPILMPAKTPAQKVSWDMSGDNALMVTLEGLKGDLTTTYGSVILDVTARCEPSCGRKSDEESFRGEAIIVSWKRYVIRLDPEPSRSYHQSQSALGVTQDKYPVHMLEKFWKPIKDGDRKMKGDSSLSRDWLMFLLSNVTSFSIRATAGNVRPRTVSVDITHNTPTNKSGGVGQEVTSIEKCVCPKEYSGLSCQNPAPGYFRGTITLPPLTEKKPGSVIGSGQAGTKDGRTPKPNFRRCQCNKKSNKCNPATGQCLGCEGDTTGDHCEKCRQGYFGDPTSGIPCQACQCPSKTDNFAVSCVIDRQFGFVCDCKVGYKGARCEQCAPGYHFANGRSGVCKTCECSPQGSLSASCDNQGKCKCYTGITGDKCDRCEPEYVLVNKTCQSCKEGCYRELWNNIEKLYKALETFNISKLDTEPLKRLQSAEAKYKAVEDKSRKNRVEALKNIMVKANKIREEVEKREKELNRMKKTSGDQQMRRCAMNKELPAMKKRLIELQKRTLVIIANLKKPLSLVESQSSLLDKAKAMVKEMKRRNTEASKKSLEDLKKLHELTDAEVRDFMTKLVVPVTDEKAALDDLRKRLEDLKRINDGIKSKIPPANAKYERLKKQLDATSFNTSEGVDKKIAKTLADKEAARKILDDLNKETQKKISSVEASKGTDKRIQDLKDMIDKVNQALLSEELNKINNDSVEAAMKAKNDLLETKKSLLEILSKNAQETKAAMAYKDIIKNIKDAQKAHSKARKDVNNILNGMKDPTLANSQKITKGIWDDINNLKALKDKREDQKKRLKALDDKVKANKAKLDQQIKDIKNIEKGIDVKPLKKDLNDIDNSQKENTKKIQNLGNEMQKHNKDIAALKKDLQSMKSLPSENSLEKKVKNIEDLKKDVDKSGAALKSTMKSLSDTLKNVQEKMDKIKELIEISHGETAQYPPPYRVGGNCIRTYRTYYLEPSIVLDIRLWLRPLASAVGKDQLIMFGETPGTPFTFAIELTKDKKLRLKWKSRQQQRVNQVESEAINTANWNMGRFQASIYQTSIQFGEPKGDSKWSLKTVKKLTTNSQLQDLPWITEKTMISIGGRAKDMRNKLDVADKNYEGCVFGLRINNRNFGTYDHIKTSPECDVSKKDQDPFESLCKVDRKKLKYVYENRFPGPNEPDDKANIKSFSFYGDGYFKFTNTGFKFNVFNFSVCPQPFEQKDPTLVMLLYDEQKNYVKVEYHEKKLKLSAKRGVIRCDTSSRTFSSLIELCSTSFLIEMKSSKFALTNLGGCNDKSVGADDFLKSTKGGFYVGGAPEYVRKKLKDTANPGKNFYGCMHFNAKKFSIYGPKRIFPPRDPVQYFGISRNAEYSCPADNLKTPQTTNHITLKDRSMLNLDDLVPRWQSSKDLGFAFSTDQENNFELLELMAGTKLRLRLFVSDSVLQLGTEGSTWRMEKVKKNTFHSVFLRVIPDIRGKSANLYVSFNSETKIFVIKDKKSLDGITSIVIGLGGGGATGDICYRSVVVGDETVDFSQLFKLKKSNLESANFLPCQSSGEVLRFPEAAPVKAVSAASVSSRVLAANVKAKRHRPVKENKCGTPTKFKISKSSVFMEYKRGLLQWRADTQEKQFDVSFKFRTIIDTNITCILSGEFSDGRTFLLLIEQKMPKLVLCKRKCSFFVLHTVVNSGFWHSVKLERRADGLQFSLDGVTRNTNRNFNSRLKVLGFGGLRSGMDLHATLESRRLPINNFGGCLQDIAINGKAFPTTSNPPSPNTPWTPCYACSRFAPGQAFKSGRRKPIKLASVFFSQTKAWRGGFLVGAEIRPNSPTGILFAMVERIPIAGRLFQSFRRLRWRRMRVMRLLHRRIRRAADATAYLVFAVYLKDGRVNHMLTVYDSASKRVSDAHFKTISLGAVKVGEWTHITAVQQTNSWPEAGLALTIGPGTSKQKSAPSKNLPSYFKSTDIQLGGHDFLTSEDWENILGFKNSFDGCIRNMVFQYGKEISEWISPINNPTAISTLPGLHYGECPYSK